MLQNFNIDTVDKYVDFFQKILEVNSDDKEIKNIINNLKNLNNGCSCSKRSRYNICRDQISTYLSKIDKDLMNNLKLNYQTENFQFIPINF